MLADTMPYGLRSTLKLLKPCRSVSRKFDLTKMLLTPSFKTATHTSSKKQEAITEVERTIFSHPPHSQNLARSDLSGGLKDAMRGQSFGRDDDVTEEVQ
jgi:hypothetical protein